MTNSDPTVTSSFGITAEDRGVGIAALDGTLKPLDLGNTSVSIASSLVKNKESSSPSP